VKRLRVGEDETGPTEAAPSGGPVPQWLQGPDPEHDGLDVGLVRFAAGVVTPPHRHRHGQVLVVTSGEGFVEADGRRVPLRTGDVVVTPPDQWHVHGAGEHGPLVHVSVTTGPYQLDPPAPEAGTGGG
jgi:quercetin dioxygenase-like cupin family protein